MDVDGRRLVCCFAWDFDDLHSVGFERKAKLFGGDKIASAHCDCGHPLASFYAFSMTRLDESSMSAWIPRSDLEGFVRSIAHAAARYRQSLKGERGDWLDRVLRDEWSVEGDEYMAFLIDPEGPMPRLFPDAPGDANAAATPEVSTAASVGRDVEDVSASGGDVTPDGAPQGCSECDCDAVLAEEDRFCGRCGHPAEVHDAGATMVSSAARGGESGADEAEMAGTASVAACWSCDGPVPRGWINCPHCGISQVPSLSQQERMGVQQEGTP
jgi:hypothetical protein